MARIRSLKPEAFHSETLAKVSVCAERTFYGMSTIADDRGRIWDKPALINGELWSMRGNHTAADLEAELAELSDEDVDALCRYTGCDGKRYVHFVTWDGHQKIDHPSKSRNPRCPVHQADGDYCGRHEGDCPPAPGSRVSREGSRGLARESRDIETGETGHSGQGPGEAAQGTLTGQVLNGHPVGAGTSQDSDLRLSESSRDPREPSRQDRGSRIVDLGSSSSARASAGSSRTGSAASRGTRIPDPFDVTPEMVGWVRSRCPGIDGERETEKFINYWTAKSGKDATKRDWVATWRNWMLNAEDKNPGRGGAGRPGGQGPGGRPGGDSRVQQQRQAALEAQELLDAQAARA